MSVCLPAFDRLRLTLLGVVMSGSQNCVTLSLSKRDVTGLSE